jgi:chromosomal replication initiation ATPase DnaA
MLNELIDEIKKTSFHSFVTEYGAKCGHLGCIVVTEKEICINCWKKNLIRKISEIFNAKAEGEGK